MGRASRRKRERQRQTTPQQVVSESTHRGRAIAVAVAVALVASFGVWKLDGDDNAMQPASVLLPDPDTSSMTVPVARAIRVARAAALAQPDSADAVGRLGQVYHAHWLYDAAATCYGIANKLAPENFRWAYLLAGIEELRGADEDRVDELFREAIALLPSYPPAYVRHADALLRFGRWAEARDAYAAAVALDPELVLAQRGLGQAALLMGDGPTAVDNLERAARLEPEDRIVQVSLARAYVLVDRSEEAAEAAYKAETLRGEARLPDPIFFEIQNLAVDPETLRTRVARGLQNGDYDMAIEAVTLLEESGVPTARQQLALASKQRANQLAFRGDFDAALPEFERASRLAPTDPEIEHNWGTVLMRRGDLEEARRHFEKAIELNPQSADSLYNLGVVLEELGRTDEAVRQFKAAAAIDPHHPAVQRLAELGVAAER
jgi:tetratricopeptide (TPR) repeat protein